MPREHDDDRRDYVVHNRQERSFKNGYGDEMGRMFARATPMLFICGLLVVGCLIIPASKPISQMPSTSSPPSTTPAPIKPINQTTVQPATIANPDPEERNTEAVKLPEPTKAEKDRQAQAELDRLAKEQLDRTNAKKAELERQRLDQEAAAKKQADLQAAAKEKLERDAQTALNLIRNIPATALRRGRLEDLMLKYPGTAAATEAAGLLKKLN